MMGVHPANRKPISILVEAGVIAYFTLTTLVMTYPLVFKMGHSILGDIGDNIYFIWLFEWYTKAIFELKISPFFNPYLNYPEGWSLASTDTTPAMILLGYPVYLLSNPVAAFNFSILLSYVLSGWSMYLWVKCLTHSRGAGLVAGTIFAFLPYRMAHVLVGHLNLSGTGWFPFYFWALYVILKQQQWSWKPILAAAVSLGLIGFSGPYYIYMAILATGVFIGGYYLFTGLGQLRSFEPWKRMIGLSLVALPFAVAPMAPYILLNTQQGLASRSIAYARMYSASPTDFILPSTDHFLWGRWVGTHFDRSLWTEATLYIGLMAGILALIAWIKRKETGQRTLIKLSVVVGLFGLVLAMGTEFHWLNQRVTVTVPAFLEQLLQRSSIPIPLPGYFLVKYFPLYSKMRALMRFGLLTLIFTSLMAGIGSAWLINRVRVRWRAFVTAALIGLVFLDFYPGPYEQFTVVSARPVDYWLASAPGQGAVIQFPAWQLENQDQVYYTSVHNKPYVGGFFSANQPDQYLRIKPVLDHFPDQASVTLLQDLGVQYVVVDSVHYEDIQETKRQIEELGLRFLDAIEGQYVFELSQP
jgi:hypothetical protein